MLVSFKDQFFEVMNICELCGLVEFTNKVNVNKPF